MLRFLLAGLLFIALPVAACETTISEGDTVKKVEAKLSCLSAENANLQKQLDEANAKLNDLKTSPPSTFTREVNRYFKTQDKCMDASSAALQSDQWQPEKHNYTVSGRKKATKVVIYCSDSGVPVMFTTSEIYESGDLKAQTDKLADALD